MFVLGGLSKDRKNIITLVSGEVLCGISSEICFPIFTALPECWHDTELY